MKRNVGWACLASIFVAGCGGTSMPPIDEVDGSMTGSATITVDVLLGNNYGLQFHPLYRSDFGAGSALGRMKLFARFCSDAACASPTALLPVDVPGVDANGRYLFSTASTSGAGFAKTVTIPNAPLGASFMQLVGDTQLSNERNVGVCSSLANCPGDLDVVQMSGFEIQANSDGSVPQPSAATVAVNVTAGADITLPGTQYLGHFTFDVDSLRAPAPTDPGSLLVAVSNTTDTFRNRVATIDLGDASSHPGALGAASYILQSGAADFAGDICGMVRGGSTLYTIGYDAAGAHVFRLSGTTGAQSSTTPVVTIPTAAGMNSPTPHPCRGVYASVGAKEHLYLIEFAGAGSLTTSLPNAIYDVNITDGTFATPLVDTQMALRSIVYVPDAGNGRVIALDMSYSQYAGNNGTRQNRFVELAVDASGNLGAVTTTATGLTSQEQCDSTVNWPTGMAVASLGGQTRIFVGHDTGVATFAPADLTTNTNLTLGAFGRLFSEIKPSSDGTRLYAMPQCKAITANSPFTLPYGAGTEGSDSNRVAVLDLTGSALTVAATTLDVDGDGSPEHGIDLDYYALKQMIRDHGTTLPIPPVVYTGPQMAIGGSMLFIRGSGIQGNGSSALSSSGMGQAQEVSFFNLATGRGILFGDYVPWTDGLSAGGGTAAAIWGYDLVPGKEGSVGWIEYLP